MAPSATQSVGAKAERLALEYLLRRGLTFLRKNVRCRFGEIDLVMMDGSCLVFVEVRFRKRNQFVSAALSVGRLKQRKIIQTASYFLSSAKRYANATTRFDVLAIDSETSDQYKIEWLKDAFRP